MYDSQSSVIRRVLTAVIDRFKLRKFANISDVSRVLQFPFCRHFAYNDATAALRTLPRTFQPEPLLTAGAPLVVAMIETTVCFSDLILYLAISSQIADSTNRVKSNDSRRAKTSRQLILSSRAVPRLSNTQGAVHLLCN